MNRIILIVALALGLAACEKSQIDTTFAIACAALPQADAVFQTYASTGRVSPAVIRNEQAAIAAGQAICNGPPPTNVKDALASVRRVMDAVLKSIATAKAQSQGA